MEGEDFIAENITFENSSPQVMRLPSFLSLLACLLLSLMVLDHLLCILFYRKRSPAMTLIVLIITFYLAGIIKLMLEVLN